MFCLGLRKFATRSGEFYIWNETIRVHRFDRFTKRHFQSTYHRIGAHRTPTHLTTSHIPTCSFWSCARIFNENSRQSSQRKKCPGYHIPADVHRDCIESSNMDISFFSLSLYIHTRHDCDTEQTCNFLGRPPSYPFPRVYSIMHQTLLLLTALFLPTRCCFKNCAS